MKWKEQGKKISRTAMLASSFLHSLFGCRCFLVFIVLSSLQIVVVWNNVRKAPPAGTIFSIHLLSLVSYGILWCFYDTSACMQMHFYARLKFMDETNFKFVPFPGKYLNFLGSETFPILSPQLLSGPNFQSQ